MTALLSLDSHEAPGPAPAGLAWDGRWLWHNDFRTGRLYRLRLDPLSPQVEMVCAGTISGLAWDGQSLWQSRLDEPYLQQISPTSLDIDRTLALSEYSRLTDVAWDGQRLWIVWQAGSALLAVDPETGRVVGQHRVPTAAAALTFDRGRLWCTLAHPMRYDEETASFVWAGDRRSFSLIGIDPDTGDETVRYGLPFLPTGVTWQDDHLWLSHATAGTLHRTRTPLVDR
ncbi:MAG: hypothetical protein R3300_06550 [Candidatus Promineifilaceae bacterium]|nr:hypothetical protein [Candidatus Promineifilaceae bacterium]